MAKIDKIKEQLTTLRVFFTVTIAIMVATGGGLVSSYRKDLIDIVFWLGFCSELIFFCAIIILINKIKSKTQEIEEL